MENLKLPKLDFETRMFLFDFAEEVAEQVLLKTGKLKSYMLQAECKMHVTRNTLERAIKDGSLPFTLKGSTKVIDRRDFKIWRTKHQYSKQ